MVFSLLFMPSQLEDRVDEGSGEKPGFTMLANAAFALTVLCMFEDCGKEERKCIFEAISSGREGIRPRLTLLIDSDHL